MASSLGWCMVVVIMAATNVLAGASKQYKVGDADGWQLPNDNRTDLYKIWASKFTFYVGDSLVFEYKNDSVVKVDKRDYYHCNQTNHDPMYKDGNTVFHLEKAGFHYFVSGDLDHCKKGQRLMIEAKGQHFPPRTAIPPPSPRPSVAISWIIPPLGTAMALGAMTIVAFYGPY